MPIYCPQCDRMVKISIVEHRKKCYVKDERYGYFENGREWHILNGQVVTPPTPPAPREVVIPVEDNE